MTTRGLIVWMCATLAASSCAGVLIPIFVSPVLRPDTMLVPLYGLGFAALSVLLLSRRERSRFVLGAMFLFACVAGPVASCAGHVALTRSRLQPLTYGWRTFDSQSWKHLGAAGELDRGRSQMTAHLLLGDLLSRKERSDVLDLLGAPDCGTKPLEDAWSLGFSSGGVDIECLHVQYKAGRVARAKVVQH